MEDIEVWKDIECWEGLYQISNMGQVKSLKFGKERILKPNKDRNGYLYVFLYKNGKGKTFRLHKLVALAFIPNDNPIEKNEINHKDENKKNNHANNLEWVTPKENCNYGTRNEKISKINSISIIQYTKDMVFIRYWDSATQASTELNLHQGGISRCCNGQRKSAGGFIWRYKE